MEFHAQQVLNALALGGAYALFALSFAVVFGFLDIINLAQASLLAAGAFAGYVVLAVFGFPLVVAFVGAVIVGWLGGVGLNEAVFRPLRRRGRSNMNALVASLGSLFVLNGVLQIASGSRAYSPPTRGITTSTMHVGPLGTVPTFQILMLAVAVLFTFGLIWFFRRTEPGRAMRAVGWNADVARLLGIPAERWIRRAFGLSGAAAALTGVMVAISFNYIFFRMGNPYLLKGLAAIILGGLGSLPGAIIGGLAIGFAETITIAYISASWKEAVTFGILMLILVMRPSGIMGTRNPEAKL